jgi:hypothetical protein
MVRLDIHVVQIRCSGVLRGHLVLRDTILGEPSVLYSYHIVVDFLLNE